MILLRCIGATLMMLFGYSQAMNNSVILVKPVPVRATTPVILDESAISRAPVATSFDEKKLLNLLAKKSGRRKLDSLPASDLAQFYAWLQPRDKTALLGARITKLDARMQLEQSDDNDLVFNAGFLYEQDGDRQKAIECYKRAGDPEALYHVGRLLFESDTRNVENLKKSLDAFCESAHGYPRAWAGAAKVAYHLANGFKNSGNTADAQTYAHTFFDCAQQAPFECEDATLTYMKGKMHLLLGDRDQAKTYLEIVAQDEGYKQHAVALIEQIEGTTTAKEATVEFVANGHVSKKLELSPAPPVASQPTKAEIALNSVKKFSSAGTSAKKFKRMLNAVNDFYNAQPTQEEVEKLYAALINHTDKIAADASDAQILAVCAALAPSAKTYDLVEQLLLGRIKRYLVNDPEKKNKDALDALFATDDYKRLELALEKQGACDSKNLSLKACARGLCGIAYNDSAALEKAHEAYRRLFANDKESVSKRYLCKEFAQISARLSFLQADPTKALEYAQAAYRYEPNFNHSLNLARFDHALNLARLLQKKADTLEPQSHEASLLIEQAIDLLKPAALEGAGLQRMQALDELLKISTKNIDLDIQSSFNSEQAHQCAVRMIEYAQTELKNDSQAKKYVSNAFKHLFQLYANENSQRYDSVRALEYAQKACVYDAGNRKIWCDMLASPNNNLSRQALESFIEIQGASFDPCMRSMAGIASWHLAHLCIREGADTSIIARLLARAEELSDKKDFHEFLCMGNVAMNEWLTKQVAQIVQKPREQLTQEDLDMCRFYSFLIPIHSQESIEAINLKHQAALETAVSAGDIKTHIHLIARATDHKSLAQSHELLKKFLANITQGTSVYGQKNADEYVTLLEPFLEELLSLRLPFKNEKKSSLVPVIYLINAYGSMGKLEYLVSRFAEHNYMADVFTPIKLAGSGVATDVETAMDYLSQIAETEQPASSKIEAFNMGMHIADAIGLTAISADNLNKLHESNAHMDTFFQKYPLADMPANIKNIYLKGRLHLAISFHLSGFLLENATNAPNAAKAEGPGLAYGHAKDLYADVTNQVTKLSNKSSFMNYTYQATTYQMLLALLASSELDETAKKMANDIIKESAESSIFKNDPIFLELLAFKHYKNQELSAVIKALENIVSQGHTPLILNLADLKQQDLDRKNKLKRLTKKRK